ncbi:hypothetical protein scyTo_0016786 [Scyliorhinus torazame]|uniref:Apolipoprotein A-IV n=1 Tax=Scyliorhinus torazame TaxID=75743 RepID=A0A401PYC4_SCYTO|nr:hypothetical protein [Scyliorhinus torazame]
MPIPLLLTQSRLPAFLRAANLRRFAIEPKAPNTMKLISIVLALTVLTGSQAFTFPWQQEHRTRFEEAKAAFWDYISQATDIAQEKIDTIKQSELGAEINDRILQSMDKANLYALEFSNVMNPLAQDLVDKLNTNAEMMRQQIVQNLRDVNHNISPYAEQLNEKINLGLQNLRETLSEQVDLNAGTIRRDLSAGVEELQEMVQLSMETFREKTAPYSEEIQSKVNQGIEQFRQGLIPFVSELQVKIVQKAQELQKNLVPYAEDLSDTLQNYDQQVRERLNSVWDNTEEEV